MARRFRQFMNRVIKRLGRSRAEPLAAGAEQICHVQAAPAVWSEAT